MEVEVETAVVEVEVVRSEMVGPEVVGPEVVVPVVGPERPPVERSRGRTQRIVVGPPGTHVSATVEVAPGPTGVEGRVPGTPERVCLRREA